MEARTFGRSPLSYARICGWLYAVVIASGIFGLFVTSKLIVRGDATATALNILGSESLWRLGFAGALLAGVCYVPVTLLLFVLLRPAGANTSLLAAFFSLVGTAIGGVGALGQFAPLLVFKGGEYLNAFDLHQLQTEAMLFVKLSGNATAISLIYFGVYCTIIGYLILKSGYFPKFLGVLLLLGGLCYVAHSFTYFLAPAFESKIAYAPVLSGIAELALCLWLIVVGVDASKWSEMNGERTAPAATASARSL